MRCKNGMTVLAAVFTAVVSWAGEAPAQTAGDVTFINLYHKTTARTMAYLKEFHPQLVEGGVIRMLDGKPSTLAIVADAPGTVAAAKIVSDYDNAGLELEARMLKLKYVAPTVALELMGIGGVCKVWFRVDERHTKEWTVGKDKHSFVSVAPAYTRWEAATQQKPGGELLPFVGLPEVPYVVETPTFESFIPPTINMDRMTAERTTVSFRNTSSTEDRNRIMVVGTKNDYERIKAFLETIDRPARMIMIECQIVEIDANKVRDIGIDALQFGLRHSVINFNTVFPGEPIPQVGFPDGLLRRPGYNVLPDATRQGFQYLFDDASKDIAGKFAGAIRVLERKGDAKVKARPRILTLDDRVNVLHIGKEVPTFDGTAVTHDATQGNFVSTVNRVTRQYVGITLNLRPRITGDDGQEVVMQMDITVNELGDRDRVFAEDLLGVPTVAVRRFTGQARVANHTPIILGGIIKETEIESTHRVPILGDIPLLGALFGRNYSENSRTEIIMMLTPHVIGDNDPIAMPRESVHFDTQDSVLFNDRYILRGRDLVGVDLGTFEPINNGKEHFTREEVVKLTLLHIVRQRRLVQQLDILSMYMGDKTGSLWWWQRKWPDQTVGSWSDADRRIYYEAAAYAIETIKNLNIDLTYTELVRPRREIILPTGAHRVSLTYNDLKTYYERGFEVLRGEEEELDDEIRDALRSAGTRTFHEFARYIERVGVTPDKHGELTSELIRLYQKQFPEGEDLRTLEYADLLGELADRGIDFMTLSTYFAENEQRYRERGVPRLGQFKIDLKAFLRMSVSLQDKAKALQELDARWDRMRAGPEA